VEGKEEADAEKDNMEKNKKQKVHAQSTPRQ